MQRPRDASGPPGSDRGRSRLQRRLQRLIAWVQRTRPVRVFSRFTDVGGGVLSAGMSFQAVFAVFAGLWVGFGILALSIRGNTQLIASITEQINMYVPGLVGDGDDAAVSLTELLGTRFLDWSSLVAAGALLWVALNWFTGTRRAVRIVFGLEVKQYRNFLLLKARDLLMAVLFFVAILLSAVVTLVSSSLFDWVLSQLGVSGENWFVSTLGATARYAAMFAVDVVILMAIFRVLAEVRVPWRRMLTGCALGGVALFGLKVLATELLSGAGSNPLLSSFAVIVGLLVWFNLICRVLLLTASWIATGLDRRLGIPENGNMLEGLTL